jgi:predicted DCC family thiol-disulfide oxidoreductase YuxK
MFLLRDFIRDMPALVYWSGIAIVVLEFLMVPLLFWNRTRMSAIYLGIFFQILLLLTLDVPATFFFLFPAMFLLFINPNDILDWIEQKRGINRTAHRPLLLYDGSCGFCKMCVRMLKIMDLFAVLEYRNFYDYLDGPQPLPAGLTNDDVLKRMQLVERGAHAYGGYTVFRRICWSMPMMYPLIPVIFFPGMGIIGPFLYGLVAKNRKCLLKNR